MTRILFTALLATLVVESRAAGEMLTAQDATRYPADISLVLTPDIAISNGANFFSQTDTPFVVDGLNLIMTSYPFPIPANLPTDVGPTFTGNPFGVSKTFSNQYQSFLGTYGDIDQPDGLVAVLAAGVGLGKTFNEVFGNGYSEAEVIDALVGLRFGNTSGFLLLYDLMSNSLDKQPAYTAIGPDSYVLGAAELIMFSTGTSAGEVVSGSYRVIDGSQPIPEPASLTSALILIATCLGLVWCRRKFEAFANA